MPVDPALAKALAEGSYVVDPRAVADAILARRTERSRELSRVLEAAQRDRLARRVEDHEPAPGPDLS
jgi:hypothetical protein